MNRRYCIICALTVTLFILAATAGNSAKAAQVVLGDKSVDVVGITSAMQYDKGFVPAKASAQALGAKVDFDSATDIVRIEGADRTNIIRIGRTSIVAGGMTYDPYPPYLNSGQAYPPVVMFNDALTMALMWQPRLGNFRWVPIMPGGRYFNTPPPTLYGRNYGRTEPSEVAPSPVPAIRTITGEVVRVLPDPTNPQIVVASGDRTYTLTVPKEAIVLRGTVEGSAAEVPVGNILPGDRVTVKMDADGDVVSVRAQYRSITGKVKSISNGMIVLENGMSLKPAPQTVFLLGDNTRGTLQDIDVGDTIVVRASPVSGMIYTIKIVPPGGKVAYTDTQSANVQNTVAEPEDQLTLNTTGPMRAGDVLVVQFKGQPRGRAVFSISGVKNNILMSEVQPGVYRGEYTVQPGDTSIGRPVTVNFTAPDGTLYAKTYQHPITIQTIPGYVPVIVSPRQGQEIVSPLVVRGTADPGAVVRVTISYRANLQRMLPLEGVTAIQDVIADQNGVWVTPELSAAAPFVEDRSQLRADFGIFEGGFYVEPEPPIIWTITATELGPNGEERSSYTVETIKSKTRFIGGVTDPLVENNTRLSG